MEISSKIQEHYWRLLVSGILSETEYQDAIARQGAFKDTDWDAIEDELQYWLPCHRCAYFLGNRATRRGAGCLLARSPENYRKHLEAENPSALARG